MMRAASASAFLFVSVLAAACSSAGSEGESGSDTPPVLEITSPERGSFSEQESVVITGRVTDDGPVRVTVNGLDIVPGPDGSFSAAVTVGRGLGFLETHAIDDSGHDVRDVRSVLAGPVATTDGSLAAPVGAHADAAALGKVGDALANTAEQIDFTAAVKAMNPVYDNGGCLGAKVNVTEVGLSNIGVALAPKGGALGTQVAIDNVVVKAHVNYKVACIGGSSDVTVRANKARIGGDLGVALSGGAIKTSLPNATVALDGFSVDASGVPGAIEDLLEGSVRDAIEDALVKVIRDKVPGLADQQLAGLVGRPLAANLLGHMTAIDIAPTALDLSAAGLFLAVDTSVVVEGGEGGMFVSTPAELSPALMTGGQGFSIALADDVANQLFSGLWAAGALDQSLTAEQIGPAAAFLDPSIATLDVHFSLPPMITTSSTDLTFALGDIVITGKNASGGDVQTIALSVQSTILAGADANGIMQLTLGEPTLKAQMIAQADSVSNKLTGEQFEGIIGGAWGLIAPMANDALGRLPMPTVAGLMLGTPSLSGQDGFVLANVPLN